MRREPCVQIDLLSEAEAVLLFNSQYTGRRKESNHDAVRQRPSDRNGLQTAHRGGALDVDG